MKRAKNVMAALLAETRPGIKGISPFCVLCHLRLYSWATGKEHFDGEGRSGSKAQGQISHFRSMGADQHAAWRVSGRRGRPGKVSASPDSIDNLKALGFTNDEIYRIVAPRRTLARRKELNQRLTTSESDRVLRLERISAMADRVFANHEKAQRWLRKRSRVLNEAPIELLQSETGATLVEEELHRIDYGMFS